MVELGLGPVVGSPNRALAAAQCLTFKIVLNNISLSLVPVIARMMGTGVVSRFFTVVNIGRAMLHAWD